MPGCIHFVFFFFFLCFVSYTMVYMMLFLLLLLLLLLQLLFLLYWCCCRKSCCFVCYCCCWCCSHRHHRHPPCYALKSLATHSARGCSSALFLLLSSPLLYRLFTTVFGYAVLACSSPSSTYLCCLTGSHFIGSCYVPNCVTYNVAQRPVCRRTALKTWPDYLPDAKRATQPTARQQKMWQCSCRAF
jgi:hypothetical protein